MEVPTEFVLRQASSEDVRALAPLFDAYRQFYDCAPDLPLAHAYLTDRIGSGESIVFMASTDDGEVVGFTQLYPAYCSIEASPIFVLYDLYVAPASRQHGVGRALLTKAEAFARAGGASRLDLSTAKTNAKAQSVYESLGWVLDEMFLTYSLPLR